MIDLPLILVTGLYVWQAATFAWRHEWASCTVFVGYAAANIGMIFLTRRV